MNDTIRLKIKRNDGIEIPYWEAFTLKRTPHMNVISCLKEIQKNPVTEEGKKTTPVIWDCNCLEEVCGACSMLINGKPRQACTALVDELANPITLEPLKKFPVVRDLMVDRSFMFENLIRIKGWVPIDGTYDLGPGPRLPEKKRQFGYQLSRCMTCGCCMESCPNVNDRTHFMGPAALVQALYFNISPTGEMNSDERLEAVMGAGGIANCGNAQNCTKACPKEIPLTKGITALNRATTLKFIKNLFDK
ncbi:MAG: succinate dehydrogenase iron-sulfur subunit [Deltaproteobacteria bacterium]|nr:MAG: succinate dehydrogenase iron-sulfur subunit [Deltaproteobacteria bacterium]